ncbi:unnamed protein product [Coccothraustes coccothraustes]
MERSGRSPHAPVPVRREAADRLARPVSGSLRRRSPGRKCSLGTASGTARRRSGAGSTGACKKERHQYATHWLSGEGALFARYERLPARWVSLIPCAGKCWTRRQQGSGIPISPGGAHTAQTTRLLLKASASRIDGAPFYRRQYSQPRSACVLFHWPFLRNTFSLASGASRSR